MVLGRLWAMGFVRMVGFPVFPPPEFHIERLVP